jgi:hypothetical protein
LEKQSEEKISRGEIRYLLEKFRKEGLVEGFNLNMKARIEIFERIGQVMGKTVFDPEAWTTKTGEEEKRYGLPFVIGMEKKLNEAGLIQGPLRESDLPKLAEWLKTKLEDPQVREKLASLMQ